MTGSYIEQSFCWENKKQPSDVLYKKSARKIHTKTPASDHLPQTFIKTLLKKRLRNRCFPVNFEESFKSTLFTGHLREIDSEKLTSNVLR